MKQNGIASLDAEQERVPSVTANEPSPAPVPARTTSRKAAASRSRASPPAKESVRYFIGKSGDPKPHLDQEVASEPEGLIVAFKSDARLFVVHEFTVEQKIERGRVSLEKAPAARPRVSTPTQVE